MLSLDYDGDDVFADFDMEHARVRLDKSYSTKRDAKKDLHTFLNTGTNYGPNACAGVAVYMYQDRGGEIAATSDVCHACLSTGTDWLLNMPSLPPEGAYSTDSFDALREDYCLANILRVVNDSQLDSPEGIRTRAYLSWLEFLCTDALNVSVSNYTNLRSAYNRGLLIDVNQPFGYSMAVIVSMRMVIECPWKVIYWYLLQLAGVDRRLAWLLSEGLQRRSASSNFTLDYVYHGHQMHNLSLFHKRNLMNFIGEQRLDKVAPLKKGYRGFNDAWDVYNGGSSIIQDVFDKTSALGTSSVIKYYDYFDRKNKTKAGPKGFKTIEQVVVATIKTLAGMCLLDINQQKAA